MTRRGDGVMAVPLAIGVLLAWWTIAVVAAGGIDLRGIGIPVLARSPWPSAVASAVALGTALLVLRGRAGAPLARLGAATLRQAAWIAAILAVVVGALAVRLNTFAAGGSDSYCYVEQAERIAAGTLRAPLTVDFDTPWDHATLSLAPTGFVPSRVVPGAIAPICPAGLALAMAVPRALGAPRISVFYLVPLFAGLTVWAAFVVGRQLAGPAAGLATAAITAASPVFLYQAVQPMSDVPATAMWLVAVASAARRGATGLAGAGLFAGAAALIRPNLAPLVGLFAAWAALTVRDESGSIRARLARVGWVVAGVLPGVLGIAVAQDAVYGSPWQSGYGSLEALFKVSNVVPNLRRYVPWLVGTQSPFILAALAAPVLACRRAAAGPVHGWLLIAFALGVGVAYLPYVPFDDWWFLRFWLPAVPVLVALMVALAAAPGSVAGGGGEEGPTVPARLARVWRACAATAAVALCAWQLGVARERGVFGLAAAEHKFVSAGGYVKAALPPTAVVLTIWHSGAVRYYGERPSILWDAIEPGQLPLVLASLGAQGREAFLLLEDWERDAFRARFAGLPAGALDWPPRARIGRAVTIWAFEDRERFLRGDPVRSERVW